MQALDRDRRRADKRGQEAMDQRRFRQRRRKACLRVEREQVLEVEVEPHKRSQDRMKL